MKKLIIAMVVSLLLLSGCSLLSKNVAPKQSDSTAIVSADNSPANAVVKPSIYKGIMQKAISKKGIIIESSVLVGALVIFLILRRKSCRKNSKR